MNPPKCTDIEYINFLVGSQKAFSCTEASRVQPFEGNNPAHDAINRMLLRLEHNTESLWAEAKNCITLNKGILVIDDSILDKPYAMKMDLVDYHWSGKHKRVVKGICVQSLVWTDGDSIVPVDFRIYDSKDEKTDKHGLFKELIDKALCRGFKVEYICFDSWYSSLENLKFLRVKGLSWLTRLRSNRLVNPDRKGNVQICTLDISEDGLVVHLKGYGMVKVFKTDAKNGNDEFWATNDLEMNDIKRLSIAELSWGIEMYHRGIKQVCGVEKCHCRKANAQKNHILFSIRSFLRIERNSFKTGIGWLELKIKLVREAVRAYLTQPIYNLITATA
jgi:hypothetical protein